MEGIFTQMISWMQSVKSSVGRTFLSALLVLVAFASIYAQPDTAWVRWYGMHQALALQPSNDGGFALGGTTNFNENRRRGDFHCTMVDDSGRERWQRVLIDTANRNAIVHGITVSCYDSSIYLAGSWSAPDGGAALIARITMDGDSLWMFSYGGNRASFKTSLPDIEGGVYAAGWSNELGEHGSIDALLINVDDTGQERWHRAYGGGSIDYCWDMIRTSDGGFALAGQTTSFGNGTKFYLVKTDANGEEEWSGAYQGDGASIASAIGQLPDGGFVMAGWYYPEELETRRGRLIIRVNAEGDEIWQRQYEDSTRMGASEVFEDLLVLPSGDIVALGFSLDSRKSGILMRFTSDGELRWEKGYHLGWAGTDAKAFVRMNDGSYALTGTLNRGENSGAYLTLTEPDTTNGENTVVLLDPAFPSQFVVGAPFPNPFNSSVQLSYSLPSPSQTSIRIYNQLGHQVADLYHGRLGAGQHSTNWDASGQPAGLYFVRLEEGKLVKTLKVTLLR